MICKCGTIIPKKRVELGYITCIECSTEKKASGHLVVHHKTGNNYEIIKNPETAAIIDSMSSRNGFGSKRRAISREGVTNTKKVPPQKNPIIPTKLINKSAPDSSKWDDENWTIKILDELENKTGNAEIILDRAFNDGKISPLGRKRLLVIISTYLS